MEGAVASERYYHVNEESDAITIVFERILDFRTDRLNPHSLEQALQDFEQLKVSDPALYAMLDAEIKQLSRLAEEMASTIPEILVGGGRKYLCPECWREYDRRSRAIDCRNFDLGVQPYVCGGVCGKPTCEKRYSFKQILSRHLEPVKVRACSRCGINQSKQNYSRHFGSCRGQLL